MQQHENHQDNCETEHTHSGGAAPDHRQCQYIKADGKGCRDWAVRGQELCYRHGVFLRGGRGIDVPLLEDESSIVLVLSETLRAVAQGTIPVNHARLLMDGCRLAHSMQMDRLKAANAERARRKQEAIEERRQEHEAASQEPGVGKQKRVPHICPVLADVGEHEPTPAGPVSPEPNQETAAPSSDTCARRPEPCEGVLAAQAEPLDERMEEELAVGVR